jgi:hypothetical protein
MHLVTKIDIISEAMRNYIICHDDNDHVVTTDHVQGMIINADISYFVSPWYGDFIEYVAQMERINPADIRSGRIPRGFWEAVGHVTHVSVKLTSLTGQRKSSRNEISLQAQHTLIQVSQSFLFSRQN